MKIIFRMPRNLRSSIILALLFSVIFPWTLMAEAVQQAPRNSLSYFLENEATANETSTRPQSTQSPEIIRTPEKVITEPQPTPGFEVAPPEPAAEPAAEPEERMNRFAAIEDMRARLAVSEAQSQPQAKAKNAAPANKTISAVTDKYKPETTPEKAVEPVATNAVKATGTSKAKTPESANKEAVVSSNTESAQFKTPATEPETLTAATEERVPFAEVLARMQQNKAKRTAEAQKLGIVLPSQGGDIATVSPGLSKMNQAIKDIMSR